jgi:rare lipoprotein A
MQLNKQKIAWLLVLAAGLAGCGGGGDYDRAMAQPAPLPPQIDGPPVIGDAYTIGGKRFEPRDDNAFDQVGYARAFGEEKRGTGTPNGELVNPDLMEGSHQTLPMPSYVEVTHLDTGKTILLRINNRGPMSRSAIVDLSPAAAQALGITGGSTPVRVRRVNPPAPEKAALRTGRPAAARLDTPPSLLSALRRQMKDEGVAMDRGAPAMAEMPDVPAQKPAMKPMPKKVAVKPMSKPSGRPGADFGVGGVAPLPADDGGMVDEAPTTQTVVETTVTQPATSGGWFVQLGAFGNKGHAFAMAKRAGVSSPAAAGRIWRVRAGPYGSEDAARAAVGQWRSKGYRDARATR